MMLKRMPKRYLDGAPEFIVDIFHDKDFVDGISVYCAVKDPSGRTASLMVLGTSETGSFSGWSDTDEWKLRRYRDIARRKRISWGELPEWIRRAVVDDMVPA